MAKTHTQAEHLMHMHTRQISHESSNISSIKTQQNQQRADSLSGRRQINTPLPGGWTSPDQQQENSLLWRDRGAANKSKTVRQSRDKDTVGFNQQICYINLSPTSGEVRVWAHSTRLLLKGRVLRLYLKLGHNFYLFVPTSKWCCRNGNKGGHEREIKGVTEVFRHLISQPWHSRLHREKGLNNTLCCFSTHCFCLQHQGDWCFVVIWPVLFFMICQRGYNALIV